MEDLKDLEDLIGAKEPDFHTCAYDEADNMLCVNIDSPLPPTGERLWKIGDDLVRYLEMEKKINVCVTVGPSCKPALETTRDIFDLVGRLRPLVDKGIRRTAIVLCCNSAVSLIINAALSMIPLKSESRVFTSTQSADAKKWLGVASA